MKYLFAWTPNDYVSVTKKISFVFAMLTTFSFPLPNNNERKKSKIIKKGRKREREERDRVMEGNEQIERKREE